MLARSADGLYWLGRYLERAAHMCRILQIQVSILVDRPVPEIEFGWRRAFLAARHSPQGGVLSELDEAFTLADAFTLAGELTFVSDHCSIRAGFKWGRENARQNRHYIDHEMWSSLNTNFLAFAKTEFSDIWKVQPERFYRDTAISFQTFFSLADATMYRDDAWHFMQLGRSLERAQATTALLAAHIDSSWSVRDHNEFNLKTLLRTFRAAENYQKVHGHDVQKKKTFDLLVCDTNVPSSLLSSIRSVIRHFRDLEHGPDNECEEIIEGPVGLLNEITREWQDESEYPTRLNHFSDVLLNLHDRIEGEFFASRSRD